MSTIDTFSENFIKRVYYILRTIKRVKEKYDDKKDYQIIRIDEYNPEVEITHIGDLDIIENTLSEDNMFKDCFVRINLYNTSLTNDKVLDFEIMKKNMFLSDN